MVEMSEQGLRREIAKILLWTAAEQHGVVIPRVGKGRLWFTAVEELSERDYVIEEAKRQLEFYNLRLEEATKNRDELYAS